MKIYKDLQRFEDKRGIIQEMLPIGFFVGSVAFITGRKGAVRGNHMHEGDAHFCYVLEGIIKYEYTLGGKDLIEQIILNEGDVIYSAPGEWHRFTFLTKGQFVAMSLQKRDQKTYEKNTKRDK